ncbi:TAXI family TRAP transporter solute-binding subunit [Natronorubrum sp. FCH18a]|uniref:TAXI family TRAP transporter solute-binding subunit n=1 Tax=Natronorubrum sp. FCH18a TaxID=3447018 RepID=UPI003F511840
MPEDSKTSRRKVLQGGAALGIAGLAGCFGGDDDTYALTVGCTSSGSSTMRAGQAMARTMDEHSDEVRFDPQATDGLIANLYEYDSGEFEAVGVGIHGYSQAMGSEGDFEDDPVEQLPHLGPLYTRAQIYLVARDGSDVESVSDLRDGGHNLFPIQPGFGTRLLTEEVLREADLWDQNEIINIDVGDAAGAFEEERIDVAAVYDSNGVALAGWVQEIDVRNDLHLIDPDDDQFIETLENFEGADAYETEVTGWEQDVTGIVDETWIWTLDAGWSFSPDVPADVTYELCEMYAEHADTVQESDETAMDYDDLESHFAGGFLEGAPVHEGVADFLEDNDLTVGEDVSGERGGDEEFTV